jgi:hypothetical protein
MICSVEISDIALEVFVVSSCVCEWSINRVTSPYPVYSHATLNRDNIFWPNMPSILNEDRIYVIPKYFYSKQKRLSTIRNIFTSSSFCMRDSVIFTDVGICSF